MNSDFLNDGIFGRFKLITLLKTVGNVSILEKKAFTWAAGNINQKRCKPWPR